MNIINIHMIKIDMFLKKLFLDILKHEILIVNDELRLLFANYYNFGIRINSVLEFLLQNVP